MLSTPSSQAYTNARTYVRAYIYGVQLFSFEAADIIFFTAVLMWQCADAYACNARVVVCMHVCACIHANTCMHTQSDTYKYTQIHTRSTIVLLERPER
jgi:hypothetical protein